MGKDTTEGGTGDIQRTMDESAAHDPSQQPATVHFLDSTKQIFYVPKKAEGSELFGKVVAFLGLNEKDYFALSFTDGDGNRHWIYEDKRIAKQLKGHPWDFNFEVKFYPPEPATLNDDITRQFLSLQVRRDISTGRLPATLATHALLGSYVAQSVRGDYEPSIQYIDFLRSCRLAPVPNETLYEKVEELHKQHKGETPAEADLHYLENAKKLSMYGVHLFPAKDGKGVPVQIGVCAHGINVYRDQVRVHRFLWQNIIKIAYRRNVFIIKVKPGELEKNDSTAAFKLPDHDAAKRVWKCAVEHHTFFRLIQPEEKPHKGLFRWGSAKFRYQGRTQFQSKMASQMFNNQPVQRSQSARLVRNEDNVPVPVSKNQTLPLNYSEDGTSKESGWNSSQMSSPEKTYMMRITETAQRRENNALTDGAEVGNNNRTANMGGSSGKLHGGTHPSATVSTTTISATTTTITTSTTATTGQSFGQKTPAQSSSLHFSPHSTQITRGAALSAEQLSGDGLYGGQSRYVSADTSFSGPNISDLQKERDMRFLPIQDTAVVYHPGHYEEEAAGNRRGPLREPPVEPGDDFVLVHRPNLGATGKIFHESGSETDILVKEEDIETYPVRYFANIYHSGFSRFTGGNRDFEVFEYEKCLGTDDVVDKRKVDKRKYPKEEKFTGKISRIERNVEMSTEPLRTYAYVYNQGYYDAMDPSRTDIDEKGNLRYWLRGYTKPEKPQVKLSKGQNTEVQGRTESYRVEKNGSKLVNGDHPIGGPESAAEREDKTKKTALIYVKQPYERQKMQASDNHTEVTNEQLQRTADFEGAKLITSGVEATSSAGSNTRSKVHDSSQSKQTYRLFTRASHEGAKEAVEKDRVGPEAYGLPSTSYEGPLHSIKRDEELPSSPIREHAAVYHPGISVMKDKKRRKLVRKENRKGSSETSSDDESATDVMQKRTAILHVSGSGRSGAAAVADGEKGSHGEEIITQHITREVEETEYPGHGKDASADFERQKYLYGKKGEETGTNVVGMEDGKSEGAGQKGKAVLYLSESQSKPVPSEKKVIPEAVLKRTEESKEAAHITVPTYSVLAVGKSVKDVGKVKPTVPPKRPLIEYAEDNTPPPEKLSRTNEIAFQPLHLSVKDVTQMRYRPTNYKAFKRATHGGTVEFVAKENVDPESYKLERTAYLGPLESTALMKELQFSPIQEHSAIYHPGSSYIKSRKARKLKGVPQPQEAEKPDIPGLKKTAVLHVRKDDYGTGFGVEEKKDVGSIAAQSMPGNSYASRQQTAYKAKIVPKVPEKKDERAYSGAKKRPFKYRGHAGDVEIVEKWHVKPETYRLTTAPYDGPLSSLEYAGELSSAPLQEHSAVYHTGISYKKAKRMRDSSNESVSSTSSSSSSSSSGSDVEGRYTEKRKAILYVKPDEMRGAYSNSRPDEGFFSFWRRSGRSEKEGRLPDVKKEKPETPPKPRLDRQQYAFSGDSFTSHETSPRSPGISTTSLRGSEYEPKSDLYGESESTKRSARLYVKDEPSTVSESVEDSSKRGKFDPFSFWRSTEQESNANAKKPDPTLTRTDNFSEEPLSHAADMRPSQLDSAVGSSTENKKKAIVHVIETVTSSESKASDLARSKDMKEEPFMRSPESSSADNRSNIEAKKSALIHLKDGSKPLEAERSTASSAGVTKQEITTVTTTQKTSPNVDHTNIDYTSPKEEVPYQPLRAKISIQRDGSAILNEPQRGDRDGNILAKEGVDTATRSLESPDSHRNIEYLAKIAVKPSVERTEAVLQKDTGSDAGRADAPKESTATSSFKLKGFHLRGPPSDSEETVKLAAHDDRKHMPAGSEHKVGGDKNIGVTVTGEVGAGRIGDGTEKTAAGKKIATLRIRDEKLIESDVSSIESKKDGGKSAGGGFFSSLWRGSKTKGSDEQQKPKMTHVETHGTETTTLEITAPADELQYKTLRAKIDVYNTGYEKKEAPSGVAKAEGQTRQTSEGQTRQTYVPVYDFSYVPNFGTAVSPTAVEGDVGKKAALITLKGESVRDMKPDEESTGKAASETKGWGGSKVRRLFGHKSKDAEEYYDAPAPPEDRVASRGQEHSVINVEQQAPKEKAFVSELSWEKSDTSKKERHEEEKPKNVEIEEGSTVYRDATSGGETSDEPYKFTQTPPDVPVSVVHSTDAKGPRGFVEQIKRQVTQVVAKASPSSEKKKKLKKEKKRSKKGASSRGSESSSASDTESVSHHDSTGLNQSKESASKPEVVGTLPYEEAKLDDGRMLLEKRTDETYHLKGAGAAVPTVDPANAAGSPTHKTVESWHETTTGPETVVTDVDYQGNVIKRTIKTQQVKHTVQRQTYQTYGIPGQNGDSDVHVVETTQKSITPVGDKNVTNTQAPVVETRSHALAYESKGGSGVTNGNDYSDIPGELISSRTITQGNRTIETITYKTEKNGVIETHVEHRVTIQSGDNIDHDAELSQAILEATNMNPDMTVEKIEVKQESQC